MTKEGDVKKDKAGNICYNETWGGFQKDKAGARTGILGYPDDAILAASFGDVQLHKAHLGGIFVAGGGAITLCRLRYMNSGAVLCLVRGIFSWMQ